MAAVRRIINLAESDTGKEALSQMKKLKECDKRVISRYAKGTKDPEPLASTMILMAKKTPFLANKSYLKHFSPQEISEAFDTRPDNRVQGKVFCSKRAFDIWLSKEVEISEQTRASIDILYKQSREMVASYFNYQWDKATIEVGFLPKSRRRVPTRIPLVDVPPKYRQAVIIELIAPGNNLYSETVTENYMETLRPILKDHIITGMHFVEQARILLNLMDPRFKWVPTIPLDDQVMALHAHCVFGQNWRIATLPSTKAISPAHTPNLRGDLSLILKTLNKRCAPTQAKKELAGLTYKKEGISDFLQRQQDILPVQYLKSLLRIECTNQFDYMGMRLVVTNPSAMSELVTNSGGVKYREYPGEEVIHFSTDACKGYFIHNGPRVSQIQVTFLDRKTLTELVSTIGCYCKWGWRFSQKKTIAAVQRECRELLLKSPETLICATPANWEKFVHHLVTTDPANPVLPVRCEGSVHGGMIEVVVQAADPLPCKVLFEINEEWTLYSSNPKAIIRWEDTKLPASTRFVSAEWDSMSTVLIPILAPVRSFPRTLDYHLKRETLYDDITKHRFQVFNDHCIGWLPRHEANAFSTLAKTMLIEASKELSTHSRVFMAFLYTFAGAIQGSFVTTNTTIFHNTATITLLVDKGIFRWEKLEQGGRWLLFDHVYNVRDNEMMVSPTALVIGALEGYRFGNPRKRKADCTFSNAKEELRSQPDLSSRTVKVSGTLLELIRDRTAQVRAGHSLKRALERIQEDIQMEQDALIVDVVKRRKLDEPGTSKE